MTADELIKALTKLPPQKTVKIVLSHVIRLDELAGEYEMNLCDEDCLDVDEAQDVGGFILIRSK